MLLETPCTESKDCWYNFRLLLADSKLGAVEYCADDWYSGLNSNRSLCFSFFFFGFSNVPKMKMHTKESNQNCVQLLVNLLCYTKVQRKKKKRRRKHQRNEKASIIQFVSGYLEVRNCRFDLSVNCPSSLNWDRHFDANVDCSNCGDAYENDDMDLSSKRRVVIVLWVGASCKRLCLLSSKFSASTLEGGCHSRCLFGFLNQVSFLPWFHLRLWNCTVQQQKVYAPIETK